MRDSTRMSVMVVCTITILIAVGAMVPIALIATSQSTELQDTVKSVIAQAYVCGKRAAEGRAEVGCETAMRYVEEVGGEEAALERIRHWAAN